MTLLINEFPNLNLSGISNRVSFFLSWDDMRERFWQTLNDIPKLR